MTKTDQLAGEIFKRCNLTHTHTHTRARALHTDSVCIRIHEIVLISFLLY